MKKWILFTIATTVFLCLGASAGAGEAESPLSDTDIKYVEDNIEILYDAGIFQGYPNGDFEGERLVTRYEAAAVLTRFYWYLLDEINKRDIYIMHFVDIRHPLNGPMDMTDIPENHWAYDEVQRLEHMGIASGYPDWTYGGSKNINRYEYTLMILRLVVLIDFGLWEALPGYDAGFRYSHLAKPDLIENAPDEYWARNEIHRILETMDLAPVDPDSEFPSISRSELAFCMLNLLDRFNAELSDIEDFLSGDTEE